MRVYTQYCTYEGIHTILYIPDNICSIAVDCPFLNSLCPRSLRYDNISSVGSKTASVHDTCTCRWYNNYALLLSKTFPSCSCKNGSTTS